jgi:hypothetical protein
VDTAEAAYTALGTHVLARRVYGVAGAADGTAAVSVG